VGKKYTLPMGDSAYSKLLNKTKVAHQVFIMANFKRKTSKRNVKCTLCTPVKWLGNNSARVKEKYKIDKKELAVYQ
jgi:hypothetical protein